MILIGAMLYFLGHPVQSCVLLGIGCFSCGSMADCMISDLIKKDNAEVN